MLAQLSPLNIYKDPNILTQYGVQLVKIDVRDQFIFFIQKLNNRMYFSPQNLRLSIPISSQKDMQKEARELDQNYLYNRLSTVLFTLQAEKQQFQLRISSQKKELSQKIAIQDSRIKQLQQANQKLQKQCRQLRFNYHQRGAVVEYLKKKITVIQKKFNSEKQEMVSVIKYLQCRNYQLNQIIFDLRKKQLQLNQNIFTLQEKNFDLTNEFCIKNIGQRQCLKLNSKRIPSQSKQLCQTKTGSMTPQYINNRRLDSKNLCSSRQNYCHINYVTLEDTNNGSLAGSSIKEKTIKFEAVNRVKSEHEFDLNSFASRIGSRESKNQRSTDLQQINGKRILINNYGNLTFNDYPGQIRASMPRKSNVQNKAKLSLPNHGRYMNQLKTKRTNQQFDSVNNH